MESSPFSRRLAERASLAVGVPVASAAWRLAIARIGAESEAAATSRPEESGKSMPDPLTATIDM
jgi:hypothetical protein